MKSNSDAGEKGRVLHALGLHMHQPPGNLRTLIDSNEFEAEQIIRCYDRVPRYAARYRDVARLHVGFSGVLLEQLRRPDIVDRYRKFVDIPAMLAAYGEAPNIEIIGMGYFHPIFPLIPREDWSEQLTAGRQIVADVFGRTPRGFWPPEMAFDMEMIPALVEAGYEYVVVDGVHVKPDRDAEEPLTPYQVYTARHGGAKMVVIPRDRDLSNAQESGLDSEWFAREVASRTASTNAPAPPLVTTWSDGENGGWFRQMAEEAGFFGHYFAPYMEKVRTGESRIVPAQLSEHVDKVTPQAHAYVRTGAWNVATTSGYDFAQWSGSQAQRDAIETVFDVSRRYWRLHDRELPADAAARLREARAQILEGETSCFLFWGDDWVPRLYERTDRARALLDTVEHTADTMGTA